MKTYNSYVEAVIENGSTKGVYTDGDNFYLEANTRAHMWDLKRFNPADYLESLADFHARGLKLVDGDILTELSGDVIEVHRPNALNIPVFHDKDRYVVKAAAYDAKTVKIDPNSLIGKAMGYGGNTETPEEKEAFDAMTDTAPQQFESLAKDEWNGEGLPPVGELFVVDNFDTVMLCKYSSKYAVIGEMVGSQYPDGMEVVIDLMSTPNRKLRKPETQEQRADHERLEAAYEIYRRHNKIMRSITVPFEHFRINSNRRDAWLMIVDETGYRKETN